uniref:Putative ovule protein n=1 Tax=Solanum chacoense TaxID=4108 RepID=A0A0V0HZD0_SOLCH
MAQTLEATKVGGGSIKVGTTGKVSALMSRELHSKKPSFQAPTSSRNKTPTVCGFIAGSATSPKRMKPRTPSDEASSSGTTSKHNNKSPESLRKTKHNSRKTHQIPILESENISVDGTPISKKPDRKGPYMVEIVDVKCRSMDRTWATPIKNSLKKLRFTKLSDSSV